MSTTLNFRIDSGLLSDVKSYCEEKNATQTEFLIDAIKLKLENRSDNKQQAVIENIFLNVNFLLKLMRNKYDLSDDEIQSLQDDARQALKRVLKKA